MSNLKKLQVEVTEFIHIATRKNIPVERLYQFDSIDYISYPISVVSSSFTGGFLAFYNSLKAYTRRIGENELSINQIEIVSIQEKKIKQQGLWQRKKRHL